MSRLIIVSNRLPITVDRKEGQLHYHPSAGGLATGLSSLDADIQRIWIGWPGQAIEDRWQQDAIRRNLERDGMVPVFLSEEEIELYYEGFSNKVIWPHFHYFMQYTAYDEGYWEAYCRVNERFAEEVCRHLQPGDIVWVHDYQLLLLCRMIRRRVPEASIGFFLHIPFPSYEVFRILPWREELLLGMLGADQIGFHTFGYMRHFLSAAYRITGFEHHFGKLTVGSRQVNVEVFPMGIDYEKYAHPQSDLFKENRAHQILQMARRRRLVLSIDRLDYTKGIPQRLRAWRQFLENHPSYRGKVTLVLVVVPSRSNVDQYRELKHEVDTLVGEINGTLGTFDWMPVQYFYRAMNFPELIALYQAAEVAFITPLRDGMNLIAKEFIASKEDSGRGVLILSEMAGAANELTDAILVNPQDLKGMVRALHTALEMNANEQEWRLRKMQSRLKKFTVQHWAESFVNDLIDHLERQKEHPSKFLNPDAKMELKQAWARARRRLLVLDYDGTLMPFHTDPKAVPPDEDLLQLLERLCAQPANHLVISSGRDRKTLESWVGHLPLDLAAEHGVWVRVQGAWKCDPSLPNGWKKDIKPVLENLVERTPGSFIEEKDYSLAWHYRSIDRDLGDKRVREFRDVLLYLTANLDLQVLEGNKVVEIKNAGVNKGKALFHWLDGKQWDFILAIGDDSTDEDTFKTLPEDAYTIKVGQTQTAARFRLRSVEEVRALLEELAAEG